jgi:hypothetical protein
MGTMYTCTDIAVSGKDDCVGMYIPTISNFKENLFAPITTSSTLGLGLSMPRVWTLPESNFDHIGSSFLALFKVADSYFMLLGCTTLLDCAAFHRVG